MPTSQGIILKNDYLDLPYRFAKDLNKYSGIMALVLMEASGLKKLANMEIHGSENYVAVYLGRGIYAAETIERAMCSLIDDAASTLIEEAENLTVELRPASSKYGPEELGREFNSRLVEYEHSRLASENTCTVPARGYDELSSAIEANLIAIEQASFADPLGISGLWEE